MSGHPAGGGLLLVSGAVVAGGNTYVAPTSEGWACGPWENLDVRQDNETTWNSSLILDSFGDDLGTPVTDDVRNFTATQISPPAVGPWNFIQNQYINVWDAYLTVTRQQVFRSYKGGNLVTADKIRMRGFVGPVNTSFSAPINFTIYRGSWGLSVPDGTGDVIQSGQVPVGTNAWVEFELEPHDDGGTRYFQYFIGIDNPEVLVTAGSLSVNLADANVGYSGPSRPDMFAPCYA